MLNGQPTSKYLIYSSATLHWSVHLNLSFVPISTIIYVVLSQLGERLLQSSNPQVKVSLPKRDASKIATPTAIAKQASARKTSVPKGQWLATTKRKPSEKKAPAKKKTKVSKKVLSKTKANKKAKSQSKRRCASLDVIEIFSDESDSKPASLATRDNNTDDGLWQGSEEEEEYEFDG